MKKALIAVMAVLLVLALAVGGFLWNRARNQKANAGLFAGIVEKMKDGDKIHLLIPDLDALLRRPALQKDIANSANILAAYISQKKEKYPEALGYFQKVKLEGRLFDIQDYVYYWWGETIWKAYKKNGSAGLLPQARDCYKKVVDAAVSPLRKRAFVKFLLASFYAGDMSFLDTIGPSVLDDVAAASRSDVPEVMFILGKAHQAKGDPIGAAESFVGLWKEHFSSEWADRAEIELRNMGRDAAIRFPALSAGELIDILSRASDDIENHKYTVPKGKNANIVARLGELEGQVSGLLTDRLKLVEGKTRVRMNASAQIPQALRALQRAIQSSDREIRGEAAKSLVLVASRQRDYGRLQSLVAQMSAPAMMASAFYPETVYSAGFPFMRARRFGEAAAIYQKVLAKGSYTGTYRDQAWWRLHWCYYHLGRYDEALGMLEKLRTLSAWEEYANYWMAYIHQKTGNRTTAEALYQEVLNRYGLTYYGFLAQQALRRDFGRPAASPENLPEFVELEVGVIEDPQRSPRYRTLVDNGLYEFAASEMEAYLADKDITFAKDPETWRPYGSELAKLYYAAGSYILAGVAIGRTYEDYVVMGTRNDPPRWFWRIYYPLFYEDVIDRYAEQFGIKNTEFLYAFIRQESFYEPYAVSSAKAIGIMQILPTTGAAVFKKIGRSLGLAEFSEDLLFDPNVNIPMGIYYLRKELYEQIANVIARENLAHADDPGIIEALMVAGYNGGPGAALRYLRETKFDNQQELIDQMDVTETRRYVKLVFKHVYLYEKYKHLYR